MSGTLVLLLFLVLIILRVPLFISMGVPSLIYLLVEGVPVHIMAHRMSNAVDSYTLLAVTMFIFAGNLMNVSGMTDKMFKFVLLFVGGMRGGLAQVNVLANLVFSGVSGSALADIGGLGKIIIHSMNKAGYHPKVSVGVTAAAATIGPIFPPSIPLVIYAVVAETSAARLLLAGVVPGVLLTILLMLQVGYQARKHNFPKEDLKTNWKEKAVAFVEAVPALLAPVILIVGLLGGYFGPTELAAFTVLYIILIGKFLYKELTWAHFVAVLKETVRSTAQILIIISSAAIFAWVFTASRLSAHMAEFFLGISHNPYVLLLIVCVILIIVGTFMESISAILVLTPILMPTLVAAGVDPVHLGIVVVYVLMLGLLHPPIGMSLYLLSSITKMPMEEVFKGTLPYFISLFICMILLALLPGLSTWLPNLYFGK